MNFIILAILGGLTRIFPVVIAKIMTAFGLGVFSYATLTVVFNFFESQVTNSMNALASAAGDAYQIMALAGFTDSVKYTLSAFSIHVAMKATQTVVKKI